LPAHKKRRACAQPSLCLVAITFVVLVYATKIGVISLTIALKLSIIYVLNINSKVIP
jgi:hypothetical protein